MFCKAKYGGQFNESYKKNTNLFQKKTNHINSKINHIFSKTNQTKKNQINFSSPKTSRNFDEAPRKDLIKMTSLFKFQSSLHSIEI